MGAERNTFIYNTTLLLSRGRKAARYEDMPEGEVVIEHSGGKTMSGITSWFVLFLTIFFAVMAAIVGLDLLNKAVLGGDVTT